MRSAAQAARDRHAGRAKMALSPLLALALLALTACGGGAAQPLGRRGLRAPFIGGDFSSASAVAVASAGTGFGDVGVYPGIGLIPGGSAARAALLVQCAGPAGPLIPECLIFFGR
jgi:hypothetical protein